MPKSEVPICESAFCGRSDRHELLDSCPGYSSWVSDSLAEAEARIAELEAALMKYSVHLPFIGCEHWGLRGSLDGCTCGLTAALATGPAPEQPVVNSEQAAK